MPLRVGFIGLGNIGLPIAANIVDAGFPLVVYDKREDPVDELCGRGASRAGSPAELAVGVDVVIVCVRDDEQVREVLVGGRGVLKHASAGTVIVIHSTIRPRTVRELGVAAAAHEVSVLDAPITGGAAGARARTLCCMVGGERELLERCRPILATSASVVVHTGALGAGAATKLCNNLMMYMGFLSVFEGVRLARAAGVPREVLIEVTKGNGVLTEPMRAYLGLHDLMQEGPANQDLRRQAQSFAELADKDLEIALEYAAELGVDLPGARRCRERMVVVYGLDDA